MLHMCDISQRTVVSHQNNQARLHHDDTRAQPIAEMIADLHGVKTGDAIHA